MRRPVSLHLLGVRGSTPAPGPAHVRYGGHTSCVAVSVGDDPPRLVLDSGTGVRNLGGLTSGLPFRGTVLLTHLHWDHTQGLPFCPVLDHPGAEVVLHLPAQDVHPEEVLGRAFGPPHFPIGVEGLRGMWSIAGLESGGELRIDDDTVACAREVPHKGGRTFGYRVTLDGRSIVYLPDHGPAAIDPGPSGHGALDPDLVRWCAGADLLLHDGQHVADEFPAAVGWGHSTVDYAVALATAAGVGRLVLVHHAPARTDDELDDIGAGLARTSLVPVTVGAEGSRLCLP